jgi:hypothetical protein
MIKLNVIFVVKVYDKFDIWGLMLIFVVQVKVDLKLSFTDKIYGYDLGICFKNFLMLRYKLTY